MVTYHRALARGQARARRAHRKAERSGQDLEDFSQSYRVPDGMARLIRLRDGSCRFPGCTVPAHQCDLDHVRPWPTGPTSPINLMCLCRRHHRIKQRDGWTVQLHPDGTVTWTDPTGLQQTTWPVDHLHLITAGATHRDPTTTGRIADDPADIPTRFEEELIELLGGPANAEPRAHPISFDLRRQHLRRTPTPHRPRLQPRLEPIRHRPPTTTAQATTAHSVLRIWGRVVDWAVVRSSGE